MARRRAKKEAAGTKLPVQTVLDKDVLDRIDKLAEMMKMTRSYFLAQMITDCLDQEEFIVRIVTSWAMAPARAIARKFYGENCGKEKAEFKKLMKEFFDDDAGK